MVSLAKSDSLSCVKQAGLLKVPSRSHGAVDHRLLPPGARFDPHGLRVSKGTARSPGPTCLSEEERYFGVGHEATSSAWWIETPQSLPVLKRRGPEANIPHRLTLGDIDPLNKVPFKRATSTVQKGPL